MNLPDNHRPDLIALIPARGGSKGLLGKNLKKVQGISLVSRAVLLAKKVPSISRVILSSDDDLILNEGKKSGCDILLKRPVELAESETPMVKVLEHAVGWIRENLDVESTNPFGLVVLQPTSPMRKTEHVAGAVDLYVKEKKNHIAGVISISPVPVECRPDNLFQAQNDSTADYRRQGIRIINKAGLIPKNSHYYRNGAALVLDPNYLSALNYFTPPILPFIIEEPLISIDSFFDLMRVEHCGRRLEPDPLLKDLQPV